MISVPLSLKSIYIDCSSPRWSKTPLHISKRMNYSWFLFLWLFSLLFNHKPSMIWISHFSAKIFFYLIPGAFCIISSLIVLRNFIFALNLSAFISRYLFLMRTIQVVKRFKGAGATNVLCMLRINFASPNFHSRKIHVNSFKEQIQRFNKYQCLIAPVSCSTCLTSWRSASWSAQWWRGSGR